MAINPTIFREYDIRGLVDPDLSPKVVRDIHRAYATFCRRRGWDTVVVARDSRGYNTAIYNTVVQALRDSGINVVDIGIVTVPIFYFAQLHLKIIAGVMITASHNPVGWSGFKHQVGKLQTASSSELQELQDIIAMADFSSGEGTLAVRDDVIAAYTGDVLSRIKIGRPLKVVVDAGNETAALMNPDILRRAGISVIEQCVSVGEPAPHEPNPSTLHALEHLAEGVRRNGADLGVGFDADGDRLGIVDETGAVVWADRAAMVIVRKLLADYPKSTIVFDVKCTQALIDEITADGGTPLMWKTGHSWIKRKAQEVDAAFAAERSGHFFFRRGYWGYDDGLFAALKFLEAVSGQQERLSVFMKSFPAYETSPVWHAPCADEVKYGVVARLITELTERYGTERVNQVNGARVSFPDGWGLVRASSNIPALVLVFEGKTKKALTQIEQEFKNTLANYPEVGEASTWESG